MHFGEVSEAWIRDVERTRRASTLKLYRIILRQLFAWRPELRERAITRGDLIAFRDARAAASSVMSANRASRALKACLNWAALNELDHPPVQLRKLLLKQPTAREKALTREERRRVLEAAALDLPVLVVLKVCEGTGFRLDEALHLWWRDVDPEHGTVTVSAKPGWEPKTAESVRTVKARPLTAWLADYRRTLLYRGPHDPVCQQDRVRGKPWSYPRSGRIFARLRAVYARAGVEDRPLTHSMRHTLASDLVAAGAPIHAVQKILGHTSPATTLGVYARAQRRDVEEAGDKLEAFREAED